MRGRKCELNWSVFRNLSFIPWSSKGHQFHKIDNTLPSNRFHRLFYTQKISMYYIFQNFKHKQRTKVLPLFLFTFQSMENLYKNKKFTAVRGGFDVYKIWEHLKCVSCKKFNRLFSVLVMCTRCCTEIGEKIWKVTKWCFIFQFRHFNVFFF